MVLRELPKRPPSPNTVWACECVCGQQTSAYSHNLKSGRTKSCGCLKNDVEAEARRILAVKDYWRKWREDNPR